MPTPRSPEEIDRLARKRAGAKLGWYAHALVFVLVNLGLFAFSRYGFGSRPWSPFPLLGWGVGVVLHGVSVFLIGAGSGWQDRLVARERERLLRERDRAGRP